MKQVNNEISLDDFQRLLNKLSLESINIPVAEIDTHLKKILRLLGRYAGVERCYIVLFNTEQDRLIISHEWSRKDFHPTINSVRLEDVPPDWLNVRKNELIIVPDVHRVKYNSFSGPEKIFSTGTKFALLIPLQSHEKKIGYLGFSSRRSIYSFHEDIKSIFRIIGELIVSLYEKKTIHSQLELAERIVSKSTGQLAFFDISGYLQFANESFQKNFTGALKGRQNPTFHNIFKNRVSAGNEKFFTGFNLALAGKDSRIEVWIKIKNSLCLFEIFLHCYMNSDGSISGVFFNSNNITERVQLEAAILKATYRERKKIGINLHDDLGHDLLAIDIRLKLLSDRIKLISPETSVELAEIQNSVKDMMNDVRRLSHGLIPFKNQGLDIREMLDAANIMMYKYYSLHCETIISPEVDVVDESVIGELYNIIIESVVNSVKHSGCDTIRISIYPENNLYVMTIADNGKGIRDINKTRSGAGIEIMKYRARSIGGLLEISSSPDNGTTVKVTFNPKRLPFAKE